MRARRFENSVAESDKQNDKPKTKDNLKLKTLLTTAAIAAHGSRCRPARPLARRVPSGRKEQMFGAK
jgi:hypothetical protein